MMDKELPSIAERDLRAEEEWCRVALNAQSMSSRLSVELAGLARYHEAQGELIQQAVAELARLRYTPVAVEVPERPSLVLDLHGEPMRGISLTMYCRGWDDLASKLRPIPSDRVLKEGEVAVPVGVDCTDVANRAQLITGRSIWPDTVKAILDALRSGEAEGRKG